jgi:hypothetical protein
MVKIGKNQNARGENSKACAGKPAQKEDASRSFFLPFPVLPDWANFWRAYGACNLRCCSSLGCALELFASLYTGSFRRDLQSKNKSAHPKGGRYKGKGEYEGNLWGGG